jgi:hypothetical protein
MILKIGYNFEKFYNFENFEEGDLFFQDQVQPCQTW